MSYQYKVSGRTHTLEPDSTVQAARFKEGPKCFGAYVGILVALGAVGGCSTTSVVDTQSSVATTTAAALGERNAYLTYFLPQTVFVATVKTEASAGGGDKLDPSPTVNNIITIQNGAAKVSEPDAAAGAGGATPKKACVVLRENYEATRAAQITFVAGWGAELAKLEAFGVPDHPTRAQKAAAKKAYASLLVKISAANTSVEEARRIAAVFDTVCPTKLTITLTAEVAPDLSARQFLLVRDINSSADQITAKIDERGLLTAISTTADDKTAEALTAGVKSIATVVSALQPVSDAALSAAQVSASALVKGPMAAFAGTGPDPWVIAYRDQVEALRAKAPQPLPPLGPVLPAHTLRIGLSEVLRTAGRAGEETPSTGGIALGFSGYGLHLNCSPEVGDMTPAAPLGGRQGVLTSLPRACDVRVGRVSADGAADGQRYLDIQRTFITVLDSRFPIRAPLERSRFVARKTSYEFADGSITSVSYDKPSTAAAAWALPGTLVGSLFSGLVAGVQGPQGRIKAQADYLDAKAGLYKSEAALIEARAKAEDARQAKLTPATPDIP